MLTELDILGILTTEEMSRLGSYRFPDAYEDYSGAVSWLSFVQGAVVFHFWQSMDFKGFEFHFLVHACRDKCTVVRIGSILVPRSILLCILSIKCNPEILSGDGHTQIRL